MERGGGPGVLERTGLNVSVEMAILMVASDARLLDSAVKIGRDGDRELDLERVRGEGTGLIFLLVDGPDEPSKLNSRSSARELVLARCRGLREDDRRGMSSRGGNGLYVTRGLGDSDGSPGADPGPVDPGDRELDGPGVVMAGSAMGSSLVDGLVLGSGRLLVRRPDRPMKVSWRATIRVEVGRMNEGCGNLWVSSRLGPGTSERGDCMVSSTWVAVARRLFHRCSSFFSSFSRPEPMFKSGMLAR